MVTTAMSVSFCCVPRTLTRRTFSVRCRRRVPSALTSARDPTRPVRGRDRGRRPRCAGARSRMTSTRSQPVRVRSGDSRSAPGSEHQSGRGESVPVHRQVPGRAPPQPRRAVAALRGLHRGLHGRRRLRLCVTVVAARRRFGRHLAARTPVAPVVRGFDSARLAVGCWSPGRGSARALGPGGPGRPRRTDHVRRSARRSRRRGGRRPRGPAHQLRAGDALVEVGDLVAAGQSIGILQAAGRTAPRGSASTGACSAAPASILNPLLLRRWRAGPVAPPAGSSPGRRWSATGVCSAAPRSAPATPPAQPGPGVRRPGPGRRECQEGR